MVLSWNDLRRLEFMMSDLGDPDKNHYQGPTNFPRSWVRFSPVFFFSGFIFCSFCVCLGITLACVALFVLKKDLILVAFFCCFNLIEILLDLHVKVYGCYPSDKRQYR